MELPDRIRAARNRAGLSQRQMARALGVTPSAVAQWELGDTTPTHEHLLAIAAATNSDVAQIFGMRVSQPDPDADLRALIQHWQRLPPERRGMVLRLILAATNDSSAGAASNQAPATTPKKRQSAA
jgi:transcriptional regulator with XRE-family HTH domain